MLWRAQVQVVHVVAVPPAAAAAGDGDEASDGHTPHCCLP
jgi:hypothetical protein